MPAFTVHTNRAPQSRKDVPFLLDIQHDLLSSLGTRVVVPLYLKGSADVHPIARLTPLVRFRNRTYVAMVPELAGISSRHLGPAAGDLSVARSEILAALDLLFTGF